MNRSSKQNQGGFAPCPPLERYGRFLAVLAAQGLLDPELGPGERVTFESVALFFDVLRRGSLLPELTPCIDHYLAEIRPRLLDPAQTDQRPPTPPQGARPVPATMGKCLWADDQGARVPKLGAKQPIGGRW